ncbi:MAG: TonB-dependent receptor, partial [Candidatus Solibacter usitatus]|nr:TonB-dependent receptor [Candidatus Solibacter usitatus]
MVLFRRVHLTSLLLAAGALSLIHAVAYAQLSTASINGTVRDSTGSIVPGAVIVLSNSNTSVERSTLSNASGNYVFLNIIPGSYTLEAKSAGFATSKIETLSLAVNQTVTLDFSLSVGSIEQSVTVEAVGAEVQSSTSELGAVVSRQQVVDLPLNGRNFTQLLALTPGVAPVSVSQNSGGFGAATTAGSQFVFPSINGQNNRSNFFMLDGVNNQGAFTSTYAVPPIIDTIQEFKVNSHNDQAEFGGALGGIINVVTKSGTNELHGSVWEYLRNDAFDARNTFLASVTPFKLNLYGAAVGGPVSIPKVYNGRNRTFFYAGWQGFRYRRPAFSFFRVPTEANLRGDLSDWPRRIHDPFTTRLNPDGSGTYIRDPFAGNMIPASRIDAGMLAYAKQTLPAPVFTGNADRNGLDTTLFKQQEEEYSGRIDHTLSEKDFLWFRWSGLLQDQAGSGGRQALVSTVERRSKNWALSWVRTFNPSTVLQVQFGRIHGVDNSRNRFRQLPAGFDATVGFQQSFAGSFVGGEKLFPGIGVNDFFSGGESNSIYPAVTGIYQYKANASKIHGDHTFKWGGELNTNNFENFIENAGITFSDVTTTNPASPTGTGSSLASFLLNTPDAASRRNVHETARWGGVLGLYFQDQWKVTPKLTVNLGFRYDRTFQPPYGKEDTVGQSGGIETGAYDMQRGVYLVTKVPPSCADRGHPPCLPDGKLPEHVEAEPRGKIYHDSTKNFQPRVGLAYRLRKTTAIRASFGMFFDNWAGVTQTAQNYEGGWPDLGQQIDNSINTPNKVPGTPTPTVNGTNPFPRGLFPAPTPFNQVLWYMDPHAKNPYSMQWNFGVQHQVSSTTVVTANYVGSGSRRLILGGYYNTALKPGPGNFRDRAPFPYIAPTYYDRSWGRSNYHALQFLLDKKYRSGFAYMVSYTYSKAIDIGSSGWYGVEGHSVQDPYNFNNDRSPAGFDLTQVLTVSWLYALPIGKGKPLQTGS